MKLPKSPSYYLILESYMAAVRQGSMQTTAKEIADSTGYRRLDGGDTFKIFQDITVVVQGLLSALAINEQRIVHKIMDELCMNNALWYYEPKNTRDYTTLKSLVNKKIIVKTEDPHIFMVNPYNIRRGTIPSVMAQTMKHLSTSSKVHKTLIRDLRYKEAEVIQYDIAMCNNSQVILPPSNTPNNT